MSGMRATTLARLGVLSDYLGLLRDDRKGRLGNTARGLDAMKSTVDDIIRTHGGKPPRPRRPANGGAA